MRWPEVTLRLALLAGLLVAAAYHASGLITAPLGLLAITATAELGIRPWAQGAIDRLLLGCGAMVTALILTGLVLNLTPWGLTRMTWAIGWAILSVGVLTWRRDLGFEGWPHAVRIWPHAVRIRSFGLWFFAAGLIVVVAGILATAGIRHWSRQPDLAFSLVSANSGAVVVEIDATSTVETYRIVGTSAASGAQRYVSAPLTIRSGGNGVRVRRRLPINTAGSWKISLEAADTGQVVRWLKADVRQGQP